MHAHPLPHGFPTVFGRGLLGELKHIANPPILVVTMADLWPLFAHAFEAADYRLHLGHSLDVAALDRDALEARGAGSIIGLGGGQALDTAKYFAWKTGLPLFQAPTALSVNAVYGQRSGVRVDRKIVYRGFAEPLAVYIDYDVIAACPPMLNYSGIGDILCFHTGILDWRYAEAEGKVEPKWRFDDALAAQSLAKVRAVVDHADDINALNDRGIEVLIEGLRWGTSYHGAGWCPRHIEGTDHFVFYALEMMTRRRFLHGQPVGLGTLVGTLLHDDRAGFDELLHTMVRIGLDVRPAAMGLTWHEVGEALGNLRRTVNALPLWHSIAHDVPITDAFVGELRERLTAAYPG